MHRIGLPGLRVPGVRGAIAAATLSLVVLVPGAPGLARGETDEGMWTFDNPPTARLRELYGFTPTPDWLEHVRLATVRLNSGGSGSFVSPHGLVMTNLHVALDQIQKLSREGADYVASGFYAGSLAGEIKTPDVEINVLVSMEPVTTRVRSVVRPDMSEQEALMVRRAEIARLEKQSLDETGFRSNIVNLYNGGQYWLYRYKRYTDVRLVMSPEAQAGFFGGDSDNFTYPRYCLDVAFLRVYENGEPAETPHYLQLNANGPSRDELIFVIGNPGSTDRLFTSAQLEYQREVRYPIYLDYFETYAVLLREYARLGPEQARRAQVQMLGVLNSTKAFTGEHQGLLNEELMAELKQREEDFRRQVAAQPDGPSAYGQAWQAIARATDGAARTFRQRLYRSFHGSSLTGLASTIVRYVVEVEKPDADRLPGYHDSELEARRFRMFSPAPIYPDMEETLLGGFLEKSRQQLGDTDRWVGMVLNGRPATEAAAALIQRTELADVEFRRALVDGGPAVVNASDDPLITLIRTLNPSEREDEAWYRDNVTSVLEEAGQTIAEARFAIHGTSVYPDATFTPRLAYGTVKGYPMNGTKAPHQTTLYGLYDRAVGFGRAGEFALPDRFWDRRDRLDLSTPVNFVSTADIIGGNSGSPVINRDGEAVGLIFDGNIESLVGRFAYEDSRARAVAVHPGYIMEALSQLYDAEALVRELEGQN